MKGKIVIFALFIASFLCTSCVEAVYAETTYGGDETEMVVRYGTPHYRNNVLIYYHYNGYYFYPYRYGNVLRYHRYTRPLPPPRHHFHNPPQIRRVYRYSRPIQHPRSNVNMRGSSRGHNGRR